MECAFNKYSCDFSILKLVDVWTVVKIDYVTWKIVPKLDYLNKEGIFITVSFCEFGLYLILIVGSHLSALAQSKISTEV